MSHFLLRNKSNIKTILQVSEQNFMHPFFVYGTLLPGQPNDYLWGDAITKTETAVFPNGILFDMGHYPMMIEQPDSRVQGRLITVKPASYATIVANLDALEGYDPAQPQTSPYRRVERAVLLENGRSASAWLYLGHPRYVVGLLPMKSNDWIAHVAVKQQQIRKWWATIDTVAGLHAIEDNER